MKFCTIKSRQSFSEIMKNGEKITTGVAILLYKKEYKAVSDSACSFFNVGIIASKKVFKKAVSRNFVKRRMRAAIREITLSVSAHKTINLVCIMRARAEYCKYNSFKTELEKHLRLIVKP